jgi:DNA-binding NarL/FixJ family response regulator
MLQRRGEMLMRCKVVLYGDSVMLAGVGRSLERYPRLEVISLDASGEDALRELEDLHPEAVILDLSIVTTDFGFSLLRDHRDLLLIGLDPGGDRLLVLSGQKARSLTTEDLARLIETGVPLKPRT